jgi:hypothetical protein
MADKFTVSGKWMREEEYPAPAKIDIKSDGIK